MKDYKRFVLWIDYFNSTYSRDQGRRTPVSKSVKDPTLDELAESARRLGYKPVPVVAKFPSRMMIPSGFVSVEKKTGEKKSKVISDFSKMMSIVRGERTTAAVAKKH
ncbi:MAG: signal recognition particle subunit SRP19/SEC65 family protein [Nitrososphaerales archaeon]